MSKIENMVPVCTKMPRGLLEARYSGSDLVRVLCAAGARKDINEAAGDFYLYSLKLASLDRAEVQDDSFIQHAEFRAVVQF